MTEAEVVKSDEVLSLAAAKLGNRISSSAIDTATKVSIPAGSQVLAINFTQARGVPANEGSDAVAESYLEVRQQTVKASIDEQLSAVKEAEKSTRARMRRAAQTISDSRAGSASLKVAQRQLEVAAATLATLAGQRTTLMTTPTSPGQVLSPGREPKQRLPTAGALLGFVAGGLIGAIWNIYGDVRRQRTGSPSQKLEPEAQSLEDPPVDVDSENADHTASLDSNEVPAERFSQSSQ